MKTILTLISCLAALPVAAQTTASWQTPANQGLNMQAFRFHDVYFWSRTQGMCVNHHGQIFRTADGATTWQQVYPGPGTPTFRSIEALNNGQVIIVGSGTGNVLRSTDTGATWQIISSLVPDTSAQSRYFCGMTHDGDTVYAVGWWGGTRPRLYKGANKGLQWQTTYIDTSLATGLVDIVSLGNGVLVAGGHKYSGAREESVVLRSADGGSSWSRVFNDTNIGGTIWKLQAVTQNLIVGAIQPLFQDDTVAIIRSKDGGQTWTIVPVGSRPSTVVGTQGVGFLDERRGWVGGYYTGLFQTLDSGATWNYLPFGNWHNRFFKVDDGLMYSSGKAIYRFYDSSVTVGLHSAPALVAARLHTLHQPTPNPTNGELMIHFTLGSWSNVRLDIIDITARRVHLVVMTTFEKGEHRITYNTSGLTPGLYVVKMETDEGPQGQNFAIVR